MKSRLYIAVSFLVVCVGLAAMVFGQSAITTSGPGGGFWQRVSGVLSPRNSTDSLAIPTTLSASKARVVKTSDATLTAQECRGTYICNLNATGEVDLVLDPLTADEASVITVAVESPFVIELNPPVGELLMLDGEWLENGDCIDSPTVIGSLLTLTRSTFPGGTTRFWHAIRALGNWADSGVSD